MENTTKKDPRDYTLRELPALCASMDDCEDCPIDRLRGPCQGATIPADWELETLAADIDPDELREAFQKFADEIGPGLMDTVQVINEALKTVATYIRDNYIGETTRMVTLRGGESITIKVGRDHDDH